MLGESVDEPYAERGEYGKPRWVGSTEGFAFLPQLPDKWPWPENRLSRDEAVRRLSHDWDSDVEPLKIGNLAQRSERIGMQGWFGSRVDKGSGPEDRRYAPELYVATFAWVQAEEAHKARRVANRALIVAVLATLVAAAGVVLAARANHSGGDRPVPVAQHQP
jgi:hypothetical protein